MNIDLTPGDVIRRTLLHEEYGGRRQGGISPSKQSDNVFLITAPGGEQHGYIYDGPRPDGYFHYTGEGQNGDQLMAQGNRAIRDHDTGPVRRELHLFRANGTELTYLGEYRYIDHYTADAPDSDSSAPLRSVIVFRLEQLSGINPGPNTSRLDRLDPEPYKEIPVEQAVTEATLIEKEREPYEAERREQKLVRAFLQTLEGHGHDICRIQFRPRGEPAALFCDLYDKTTHTLYEAKGTVARPAIRMAIGQLADYSRLMDPAPTRAILLPQEPREDLRDLIRAEGVALVWREDSKFRAVTADGTTNAV